jgi:hypothetical protein
MQYRKVLRADNEEVFILALRLLHLSSAYWRLGRKSKQGVQSLIVETDGSLAHKVARSCV